MCVGWRERKKGGKRGGRTRGNDTGENKRPFLEEEEQHSRHIPAKKKKKTERKEAPPTTFYRHSELLGGGVLWWPGGPLLLPQTRNSNDALVVLDCLDLIRAEALLPLALDGAGPARLLRLHACAHPRLAFPAAVARGRHRLGSPSGRFPLRRLGGGGGLWLRRRGPRAPASCDGGRTEALCYGKRRVTDQTGSPRIGRSTQSQRMRTNTGPPAPPQRYRTNHGWVLVKDRFCCCACRGVDTPTYPHDQAHDCCH